jgi:hypothetical protein
MTVPHEQPAMASTEHASSKEAYTAHLKVALQAVAKKAPTEAAQLADLLQQLGAYTLAQQSEILRDVKGMNVC